MVVPLRRPWVGMHLHKLISEQLSSMGAPIVLQVDAKVFHTSLSYRAGKLGVFLPEVRRRCLDAGETRWSSTASRRSIRHCAVESNCLLNLRWIKRCTDGICEAQKDRSTPFDNTFRCLGSRKADVQSICFVNRVIKRGRDSNHLRLP